MPGVGPESAELVKFFDLTIRLGVLAAAEEVASWRGDAVRTTRRILIVSADQPFREQFGEQLILADDFDVFEAEDGESGIERALGEAPDLVALALELPDMDGGKVCSRMRVAGIGCPIVILADGATDSDAIMCLDAGANDFVSMPFSFQVVLARIRSHLRQHDESGEAALPLGPFSFFPGKRIVTDHGRRRIRLTVKEARILRCLIGGDGRPVPRARLLREIWDHGVCVKSHTLETHIYRLRRKIEPDPKRPAILLTDSGGYRIGFGYALRDCRARVGQRRIRCGGDDDGASAIQPGS